MEKQVYNKALHHLRGKSVSDILSEYRTLPEEQFQRSYLIKFNKDGSVFDKQNKVCYNTLQDWARIVLSSTGDF